LLPAFETLYLLLGKTRIKRVKDFTRASIGPYRLEPKSSQRAYDQPHGITCALELILVLIILHLFLSSSTFCGDELPFL